LNVALSRHAVEHMAEGSALPRKSSINDFLAIITTITMILLIRAANVHKKHYRLKLQT